MPLEGLVRPFETPSAQPVAGVASVPQMVPDVILSIVGNGTMKTGAYSYSWSYTGYADAKQNEVTE